MLHSQKKPLGDVWGVFAHQVPAHMWCPTSLMGNGVETQYPVPEPSLPLNFIHSTGMCYEAEEVHRCLLHDILLEVFQGCVI
ncbi:trans-1,2-dihydrobenzene-1,2-diol dehydrogenase-like [Sinocyclocheilus anshuiensis]|uniref:trans-1,2-dihydrobenzene-1,2-diol dehydrogenase-like n=1 Tax=Sinocyclocheilus anshuiensis TaxID=1608454 RepID=UPI0007B9186C|nr:PREDICTED: trans-1,2-dihydrobenzene-1,2-diol dehydrogenase-like [Sinocyclocheilus anshuiensis]